MIAFDGLIARKNPEARKVQAWESWRPGPEDYPQDGPKNKRIEIVNYDEFNDISYAPIIFLPASSSGKAYSVYEVDKTDIYQRHRESVFGTILRTIDLFEEKDALGRRIPWQFGDIPIKVYPYGKSHLGAEYSRYDQWLKFSYIPSPKHPDENIYTCASPDIIAHETAHAILDSIASELHGGLQSLEPHTIALHEAIADLTTVFLTLTMSEVRGKVLDKTQGNLRQPCEIGWIAEEYGAALSKTGNNQYLRNLWSEFSLNDKWGDKVDEVNDIYNLSLVFSSAIYEAMVEEYHLIWQENIKPETLKPFSLTGKALFVASKKIRKMLFRALDYLPPSNMVTFLDIARAILVADAVAYPKEADSRIRKNMAEIFVKRGIANSIDDLSPQTIPDRNLFLETDLERFIERKSELHQFVDAHRSELGLPMGKDINPQIHKRTKFIFMPNEKSHYLTEYIIKVSWSQRIKLSRIRKVRQISGISVAVDYSSRQINHLFSIEPDTDAKDIPENRNIIMGLYLDALIDKGKIINSSFLTSSQIEALEEPYFSVDKRGNVNILGSTVGLHSH